MADEAVVTTAPDDAGDLTVKLGGVDTPAVTIEGALYVPAQGDDVVTIPLSDGSVLILGPI